MNESVIRSLAEAFIAAADPTTVTATEVGRVFSAKNEAQLRSATQALQALLAQLDAQAQAEQDAAPTAVPVPPGQAPAAATPVVVRQSVDAPTETVAQEAVVPLMEAARSKGLIKVIDAGWGSSGFYSPAVLTRDAATAFPRGTKMYWDHPDTEEAKRRPERSLRDLAAETTDAARWMESGPDGPGVYAPAKVFGPYQPAVEELAPHIGVSIRAAALMRPGEAEGRKGPIVERLLPSPTNSIDFVTIPGRGGRIASLFEAARGRNTTEDTMDDADIRAAQEAQRAAEERAARAELAVAMLAAKEAAGEVLATIDLPTAAKARITERMTADVPMVDGALDRDTFTEAVRKAAVEEKAYLDTVTGRGTVRGMGTGGTSEAPVVGMEDAFKRLGLSESAAKVAASGRR